MNMATDPNHLDKRRSFRDLHGRSAPPPLWRMLPQAVPYGVIIDPTNLCNFQCPFCPTGNRSAVAHVAPPRGSMKFELYEKLIRDLRELTHREGRKVHHLQLFKDGEPLLHKRLPDMVLLAKQAAVADAVEVTTNASLLTRETGRALLDAGLDVIRISVEHVSDTVYRSISNRKAGYEDIRKNVTALFSDKVASGSATHIHAKIIDTGLSQDEKARFTADFAPICDSWNIESVDGRSRAEVRDFTLGVVSITGPDGMTPRNQRLVCPEPFAKLAVNFDGSVSICCVDWTHGTVVGDATRESLSEIWNGERLAEFRLAHLLGRRASIPACATCDFIECFPAFADLDEHRAELIEIFRGVAAG